MAGSLARVSPGLSSAAELTPLVYLARLDVAPDLQRQVEEREAKEREEERVRQEKAKRDMEEAARVLKVTVTLPFLTILYRGTSPPLSSSRPPV